MRLIVIEHERCAEFQGDRTWVIAPEDMTAGQINDAITEAQKDYLKAWAAFDEKRRGESPPDPGYRPAYDAPENKDKTIAEVKAAWQVRKDAYDAYQERAKDGWRRFENFLAKHGLKTLYEVDEEIESFECDWGHRHGMALQYGTKSDEFPSPIKAVNPEDDDGEDDDGWF